MKSYNKWNCNMSIRKRRILILKNTNKRNNAKMRYIEARDIMNNIAHHSSGKSREEALKDADFFNKRARKLK